MILAVAMGAGLAMAPPPPPLAVTPNWRLAAEGLDGTTVYVDPATVQHVDEYVVKVWTRRDTTKKKKVKTEKLLVSFDCRRNLSRYDAAIAYTKKGTAGKQRYTPAKDFLPVVPDSSDWAMMTLACRL
ncbi:MAG TPA: surface-adhesin E family protein [Sphingomonas sp.]|uniref:surface-adhesin E family protein n=1 Tax=Sphingomonas sp. TaxID=28214 RepID=UPI002ED8B2A8